VHSSTSIRYNRDDSDSNAIQPQDTTLNNALIIGANSAIARASARRLADNGCRLALVARNEQALKSLSQELTERGASHVDTLQLDLNDSLAGKQCSEFARSTLGTTELILVCHGSLPEQSRCEHDESCVQSCMQDNALSAMALLCHLAPMMQAQGSGCIAVITSVAGERGRASNYIYGSAKAALICYLQGLRASLHSSGVHVIDVRPGLIDTPMTAGFAKGPLWSSPERVARDIERGVRRARHTVYSPPFWRWIMLIIRLLPEALCKRLRF